MHFGLRFLILFPLCGLGGGLTHGLAQSTTTASRLIAPSVFVGASGVATGLDSGRNLSVTAGMDVAFHPLWKLEPALEYRGMYAIDKGQVDSVKSNLVGLKLFKTFGRLQPYGDLLAGRGETTYGNGGFQVPGTAIFYTRSSSNVFSLGGGADLFATEQLALKVDVQGQRYSSPVTSSRHVYSETATVGLVYVFLFGHGPR